MRPGILARVPSGAVAGIAGLTPRAREADHATAWRDPSSGGTSRRKVRGAWLVSGSCGAGRSTGQRGRRVEDQRAEEVGRGEEGRWRHY